MYAALEFERALARGAAVDVTLVNHDNFFLFTPMLHEVAASDLDITMFKLPRFEKKLLVALDWTLDVLFSKDLVHFRTTRPPAPPPTEGGLEKPV